MLTRLPNALVVSQLCFSYMKEKKNHNLSNWTVEQHNMKTILTDVHTDRNNKNKYTEIILLRGIYIFCKYFKLIKGEQM